MSCVQSLGYPTQSGSLGVLLYRNSHYHYKEKHLVTYPATLSVSPRPLQFLPRLLCHFYPLARCRVIGPLVSISCLHHIELAMQIYLCDNPSNLILIPEGVPNILCSFGRFNICLNIWAAMDSHMENSFLIVFPDFLFISCVHFDEII